LSPSQKYEIFLQLVRQEATMAEAAEAWQVNRATIMSRSCRPPPASLTVRCRTCVTTIAVHTGDIPTGTLRKIERDLEPCLGKGGMHK
jgi:hypothetical protein